MYLSKMSYFPAALCDTLFKNRNQSFRDLKKHKVDLFAGFCHDFDQEHDLIVYKDIKSRLGLAMSVKSRFLGGDREVIFIYQSFVDPQRWLVRMTAFGIDAYEMDHYHADQSETCDECPPIFRGDAIQTAIDLLNNQDKAYVLARDFVAPTATLEERKIFAHAIQLGTEQEINEFKSMVEEPSVILHALNLRSRSLRRQRLCRDKITFNQWEQVANEVAKHRELTLDELKEIQLNTPDWSFSLGGHDVGWCTDTKGGRGLCFLLKCRKCGIKHRESIFIDENIWFCSPWYALSRPHNDVILNVRMLLEGKHKTHVLANDELRTTFENPMFCICEEEEDEE